MRESLVETVLGAAVVAVAGAFLWFSLSTTSEAGTGERYEVLARFNSVDGIERGSDVKFAGVKVGIVREVEVDFNRAEAKLILALNEGVLLADDADARIVSGLFGGSHIALEQGGSLDNIATDGSGEILFTRGSVDLLTLFASFAQGGGSGDTSSSSQAAGSDDPYGDLPDFGSDESGETE